MKVKKCITIVITLFVLSFINAVKAESQVTWRFEYEGINVEVYAPYQAYAGDTIAIRVRVEAKEDLQDVYLTIQVCGAKSEGYDSWSTYINVLSGIDLSSGVLRDEKFDLNIPSDVSSGLIYSKTYCSWKSYEGFWTGWVDRYYWDSFQMTYLKNKAYENLQATYNNLQANYENLETTYDNLQANYNGLQTSYNNLQTNYENLQARYDNLQANYWAIEGKLNFYYTTTFVFLASLIILGATTALLMLERFKVIKITKRLNK